MESLFRSLTLLLAVAERSVLELDVSEEPNEALRSAPVDMTEQLYAALHELARRHPARI